MTDPHPLGLWRALWCSHSDHTSLVVKQCMTELTQRCDSQKFVVCKPQSGDLISSLETVETKVFRPRSGGLRCLVFVSRFLWMKPWDWGEERSPLFMAQRQTTLLNTSASRLRGWVLVPPHLRTKYFLDLLIPVKILQSLSSMTTKSIMRDTSFVLPGLEHCFLRGSGKDMN